MNYENIYNRSMGYYGKLSALLPFGFALPPIHVMIEITYSCNLRCAMCYQQEERRQRKGGGELTKDEIKKIIDQMPPKTLISFTGGEILTKDYALEVINYATRHHYCNIVTNATLINSKIAKELVKSKLLLIGVSLDGIEGLHDKIRGVKGAFEKAVRGIELIQEEKVRQKKKLPSIDIKTVILSENIDQLDQLYKLCQKLKVNFFTLSVLKGSSIQLSPPILDSIPGPVYQICSRIAEDFDRDLLGKQIEKITKNKSAVKLRFYPGDLHYRLKDYYLNRITPRDYFPCHFPWTAFNVSPYGDIFPCIALNAGNIKIQSLGAIWNGEKMRHFRLKLKKARVFPACHGCCNLWFRRN